MFCLRTFRMKSLKMMVFCVLWHTPLTMKWSKVSPYHIRCHIRYVSHPACSHQSEVHHPSHTHNQCHDSSYWAADEHSLLHVANHIFVQPLFYILLRHHDICTQHLQKMHGLTLLWKYNTATVECFCVFYFSTWLPTDADISPKWTSLSGHLHLIDSYLIIISLHLLMVTWFLLSRFVYRCCGSLILCLLCTSYKCWQRCSRHWHCWFVLNFRITIRRITTCTPDSSTRSSRLLRPPSILSNERPILEEPNNVSLVIVVSNTTAITSATCWPSESH